MGVELGIAAFVGLVGGGIKAVNSINAANANAAANERQMLFQIEMNKINQQILGINKDAAISAGEDQAAAVREDAKKIAGTQAAGAAAMGVDVSFGSAVDVRQDTQYLAELDVLTVKNNAMRQAFGYTTQQIEANLNTSFANRELSHRRAQTLSTGGMSALSDILGGAQSFMNYSQQSAGGAAKTATSSSPSKVAL